jgi:hypothetical protein
MLRVSRGRCEAAVNALQLPRCSGLAPVACTPISRSLVTLRWIASEAIDKPGFGRA